jgi:hypothetical protein
MIELIRAGRSSKAWLNLLEESETTFGRGTEFRPLTNSMPV